MDRRGEGRLNKVYGWIEGEGRMNKIYGCI